MSIKKAYSKFKKGLDKSIFGIGATTTAKDYGLSDSMFNKGGKKSTKSIKKTKSKGAGQVQSGSRAPANQVPAQPSRRP